MINNKLVIKDFNRKENSEIKFSVIVPTYNRSELLRETLDNFVKTSTRSNYEIIIYDDASTEDLSLVAKDFNALQVRSEINQGPSVGRNIAVKYAKGSILFFLDSDTIIPEDSLETIERIIEEENYVGVSGNLSKKIRFENFASNFKNIYLHYMGIMLNRDTSYLSGGFSGIKKSIYESVGGFNEEFGRTPCEDLELGERISAKHRLCFEKEFEMEHLKHYTLKECLKRGFKHSESIVKIMLRKSFNKKENAHYQSAPKSYVYSVGYLGLALICLLMGITLNTIFFPGALGFFAMIYIHNRKFISYLFHCRGFKFALQSVLYIPWDLLFMGLGVVYGTFSFLSGKKY